MLHCNFPIDNWLSFFFSVSFAIFNVTTWQPTQNRAAQKRKQFEMKSSAIFNEKWKTTTNGKIELGGKIQTTALKPIRVVLWIRKESLLRSIHFHWPRNVEKKTQRALFSISISPLKLRLYVQTVWMSWNMKRALFSLHFNWEIFQAVCNVLCCVTMKGLALCWWLAYKLRSYQFDVSSKSRAANLDWFVLIKIHFKSSNY